MTYLDLFIVHRKTFFATMVFWGVISLAFFFFATPRFEAESKFVIQSGQLGMATGAGLGSSLGGLGGLLGFDLAGQSEEKTTRLEILKSKTLTLHFIHTHNLLPQLYKDEWDVEKETWVAEERSGGPSEQEIFEFFDRKIRNITYDPRTGVGILRIRWKDASVAATWAYDYVRLADASIRETDRREITEVINHLVRQLADQPQPEVRNSLAKILGGYLQQISLIEARSEYALKIIDRPIDSLKPYWPSLIVVIIGWLTLGVSSGLAVSFFNTFLAGERRRMAESRNRHHAKTG